MTIDSKRKMRKLNKVLNKAREGGSRSRANYLVSDLQKLGFGYFEAIELVKKARLEKLTPSGRPRWTKELVDEQIKHEMGHTASDDLTSDLSAWLSLIAGLGIVAAFVMAIAAAIVQ